MAHRSVASLALLTALIIAAGCESFDDASTSVTDGVRSLGSTITGMFDGDEQSDDPIYQCRAAGYDTGSAEYRKCRSDAVAAHCKRYGDAAGKPYQDCVAYFANLEMVRRQTRIYGYTH